MKRQPKIDWQTKAAIVGGLIAAWLVTSFFWWPGFKIVFAVRYGIIL